MFNLRSTKQLYHGKLLHEPRVLAIGGVEESGTHIRSKFPTGDSSAKA
ncbi:hypothetical protein I3842_14G109600 [Carya illinoinensis]|uniref:Uncharacterized protein n=1 Tax=Carya illinoinensis TaxID=32201 RepID=A0A922D4M4_CARIL|nr:hypothetical protein I3842_14G109600 [Carya illinoinensis]